MSTAEADAGHVLLVGGHDSSGGAGLGVDQATARDLGVRAWPVLTAVTAQTGDAVVGVWPVPVEAVMAQVEAAMRGGSIRAVKIGMMGSMEVAEALRRGLPEGLPVVLDPVLHASSGGALGSVGALVPWLDRADLLTPNLDEAAALRIGSAPARPVLLKGGHGEGPVLVDRLMGVERSRSWSRDRLPGRYRGTGCALATAIACGLAQGMEFVQAIDQAQRFLSERLERARAVGPGRFHLFGPRAHGA